jgi:alpha-mannosidase
VPLTALLVSRHEGTMPATVSFLHVEAANVVVETVKQAEDGKGIIVRLYESQGMSVHARLHSAFRLAGASEVDLMEEYDAELPINGSSVDLQFGPFEIRTLRLMTADPVGDSV